MLQFLICIKVSKETINGLRPLMSLPDDPALFLEPTLQLTIVCNYSSRGAGTLF